MTWVPRRQPWARPRWVAEPDKRTRVWLWRRDTDPCGAKGWGGAEGGRGDRELMAIGRGALEAAHVTGDIAKAAGVWYMNKLLHIYL